MQHLKPMRLYGSRGQTNQMQKTRKQMQSAFAINGCGGISRTTSIAAPCIADLAFTHALNTTMAVASALGSSSRSRQLRGMGQGRGERSLRNRWAQQLAHCFDHDGNRHIATDGVARMCLVLASRYQAAGFTDENTECES